ncbi:MAG: hypothetical protein SYR96_08650 [Actinomycetota bacterium]|nr:hypothetical protein [Actinomycetota bacterium]
MLTRPRLPGTELAGTPPDIVDAAKKYLGTPYVFGSTDISHRARWRGSPTARW